MGHGSGGLHTPSVDIVNAHGRPVIRNIVYDDSQMPGTSSRPGVNSPTYRIWQNVFYRWMFGVQDDVQGEIQLPHGYAPGTSIIPHVHWALDDTAGGAAGKVQWEFSYAMSGGVGVVFPAVTAVIQVEKDVSGDAAFMEYLTFFAQQTFAAGVESSMIVCKLERIAATGDEYGDDVALLSWDAHIQLNSMGTHQSSPPFTK